MKREDLQPIFSFKNRGAYNKIFNLSEQEKSAGIIAASAGNHAQGLAYSGNKLNIDTNIVMPLGTPFTKIRRTKNFGGNVFLEGSDLVESKKYVNKLIDNVDHSQVLDYL